MRAVNGIILTVIYSIMIHFFLALWVADLFTATSKTDLVLITQRFSSEFRDEPNSANYLMCLLGSEMKFRYKEISFPFVFFMSFRLRRRIWI